MTLHFSPTHSWLNVTDHRFRWFTAELDEGPFVKSSRLSCVVDNEGSLSISGHRVWRLRLAESQQVKAEGYDCPVYRLFFTTTCSQLRQDPMFPPITTSNNELSRHIPLFFLLFMDNFCVNCYCSPSKHVNTSLVGWNKEYLTAFLCANQLLSKGNIFLFIMGPRPPKRIQIFWNIL